MRWVKPPYGSGREHDECETDPRHAELIIQQPGSKPKELARWMQAPTVEILYRIWAVDPTVRATNRGTVLCCGVHRLRSRRLLANTHKYVIIQAFLWFPQASFHQDHASGHLFEFGRVRVLRSCEGNVNRLWSSADAQRSGSGAPKLIKLCLMCELTHLVEEGCQHDEELGEFGTLPVQHCVYKKLTQDGKVKIPKIFGASSPADLGTKRLDSKGEVSVFRS